jgi:hypothetical protein
MKPLGRGQQLPIYWNEIILKIFATQSSRKPLHKAPWWCSPQYSPSQRQEAGEEMARFSKASEEKETTTFL